MAELRARNSAQPVHSRFLTALAVGLGAITLGQLVVTSGVLGIDELVRRQQVLFACYLVGAVVGLGSWFAFGTGIRWPMPLQLFAMCWAGGLLAHGFAQGREVRIVLVCLLILVGIQGLHVLGARAEGLVLIVFGVTTASLSVIAAQMAPAVIIYWPTWIVLIVSGALIDPGRRSDGCDVAASDA